MFSILFCAFILFQCAYNQHSWSTPKPQKHAFSQLLTTNKNSFHRQLRYKIWTQSDTANFINSPLLALRFARYSLPFDRCLLLVVSYFLLIECDSLLIPSYFLLVAFLLLLLLITGNSAHCFSLIACYLLLFAYYLLLSGRDDRLYSNSSAIVSLFKERGMRIYFS